MKDRVLTKIKKSNVQQLRLQVRWYRGKPYLDLRTFFRSTPDDDWVPTRRGVTFRPQHIADLIAGFERLNDKT